MHSRLPPLAALILVATACDLSSMEWSAYIPRACTLILSPTGFQVETCTLRCAPRPPLEPNRTSVISACQTAACWPAVM